MIITKAERKLIYSYIFREGVIVCEKDLFKKRHPELPLSNLKVAKTAQSLCSKKFLHNMYAFRYNYYVLTNEGIAYLRSFLNLPEDVIPATLRRPVRPAGPGRRFGGADGEEREDRRGGFGRGRGGFGRDNYRRDGPPGAEGKKAQGPGGEFRPSFRS